MLHLLAVGHHTCTAVARSLCVSWAFLLFKLNYPVLILASFDHCLRARMHYLELTCYCSSEQSARHDTANNSFLTNLRDSAFFL